MGLSLDERWLVHAQAFSALLDTHPHLLSLRQPLFKEIVERRATVSVAERLKDWTRPFVQRQSTVVPDEKIDFLFWLDKTREVLVEAIVPVYECLKAQEQRAAIVTPPRVAQKLGLDPAGTILYQTPAQRPNKQKWQGAFSAYRVVFPQVSPDTWLTFYRMGQQADNHEREIRRLLQAIKPRVLVLPVDQFMPGSSAVVVARQLGIPTLVLLHGAVSAYNAPLTADKMGVWGELSRQQMMDLGVEPDDLVVLGSPRHDNPPYRQDKTAKRRLVDLLDLNPNKRIFTFFSNGNDLLRNTAGAVEGCADWLRVATERMGGDWQMVVRLHPNEDGRLYEGMTGLKVYKHTCDLGTALAGSDVVGALCSTALLEGVLYGKPVAQFWADGWPELADNWRRGLAHRVASVDDLVGILQRELADAGQGREAIFANWGRATETVAEYLLVNY